MISNMPKVIYYPPWEPPETLLAEVKKELAENPNRTTASDLEAMTYMNTAFMSFPPPEQWCRIYFYLVRKHFEKKGHDFTNNCLSFLQDYQTLDQFDERELRRLKDWIFQVQKKDLAERRRQEKKGGIKQKC